VCVYMGDYVSVFVKLKCQCDKIEERKMERKLIV
jgi:hypothetical protein